MFFRVKAVNAIGTAAESANSNTVTPKAVPTGRIVFASDRDGDFDICTMNPDGTAVRQLTTAAAVDRFPMWSPDGQRIAWTGIPSPRAARITPIASPGS